LADSQEFLLTPFSRFITNTKYFDKNNEVKATAFRPAQNLTFSVFDTDSLNSNDIEKLAVVHSQEERPILGHFTILGESYIKHSLKIDYNNKPKRHANIIGWEEKDDDDKEKKARILLQRAELTNEARGNSVRY
jgi:hypothetical protein